MCQGLFKAVGTQRWDKIDKSPCLYEVDILGRADNKYILRTFSSKVGEVAGTRGGCSGRSGLGGLWGKVPRAARLQGGWVHDGLGDQKANYEPVGQRGEQERRPGGQAGGCRHTVPGCTRLAEAGERPDALLATVPTCPGGELPGLARVLLTSRSVDAA